MSRSYDINILGNIKHTLQNRAAILSYSKPTNKKRTIFRKSLVATTALFVMSAPAAAQALYPITPQTVEACTVDTVIYEENFDDGTNGGFTAVSQTANAPVGLLDATNNLGNINNTVTDATIHPDLNGGAGAPSPSGGGFATAFDAQGGEPTWLMSCLLYTSPSPRDA